MSKETSLSKGLSLDWTNWMFLKFSAGYLITMGTVVKELLWKLLICNRQLANNHGKVHGFGYKIIKYPFCVCHHCNTVRNYPQHTRWMSSSASASLCCCRGLQLALSFRDYMRLYAGNELTWPLTCAPCVHSELPYASVYIDTKIRYVASCTGIIQGNLYSIIERILQYSTHTWVTRELTQFGGKTSNLLLVKKA